MCINVCIIKWTRFANGWMMSPLYFVWFAVVIDVSFLPCKKRSDPLYIILKWSSIQFFHICLFIMYLEICIGVRPCRLEKIYFLIWWTMVLRVFVLKFLVHWLCVCVQWTFRSADTFLCFIYNSSFLTLLLFYMC